jgi:hypothetical protein
MNVEEWGKYFLSAEAFVVVKQSKDITKEEEGAGKEVYGTFYIKPNFPGRCSHVSFLLWLLRTSMSPLSRSLIIV